MDCHPFNHFTHLALYCPLHHRLAILAHLVQQQEVLKWHLEHMNMTKIKPFLFPLVPILADKPCKTSGLGDITLLASKTHSVHKTGLDYKANQCDDKTEITGRGNN